MTGRGNNRNRNQPPRQIQNNFPPQSDEMSWGLIAVHIIVFALLTIILHKILEIIVYAGSSTVLPVDQITKEKELLNLHDEFLLLSGLVLQRIKSEHTGIDLHIHLSSLTSLIQKMPENVKHYHSHHHRLLRIVLKVGDLEEAIHIFRDLLEMTVHNHEEFEDGSADGTQVHYEGRWSRTILGYKKSDEDEMCIQLTFNHGIERYERGNHIHALEIQLASISMLEEAGYEKTDYHGQDTYFINCNGYPLHVIKSSDAKNRISRVTFQVQEPINITGAVIRFWTECLKFEVVGWAIKLSEAHDDDVQYKPTCCSIFRCVHFRKVKRQSKLKLLQKGEDPYVDLQYGNTRDFTVRLQMLPKGMELDLGTGHERLLLTCKTEELKQISGLVDTLEQLGGHESKKSFQLVPGRVDLIGVVAHDPNGLELCYYSDFEVRQLSISQLDANEHLRRRMSAYKKKMDEKKKRGSYVRFNLST